MRGGWREWVLTTKNRDNVYYDGDFSLLELSEGSSIFLSHRIWKGGAIKFSPSKIVNFKWNSHYFFCGKKKIFSCSQELVFWSSFSAEFRQPDRDHLGDRNAGQCLRGQRVAFAEHLPGGQGGRAGWETARLVARETARRAAPAGCQGEPGPRPDRRAVAEEQCSLPSSFFRHSPHSIPHSVSTLPPVLPSAPRGRSLAPQTDPWHLAPRSPSAVRSRHCLLFDATFLSSARQRRLPAFSTSLVFTSPPPTASHLSSPSLEVTPPRSCL